MPRSSAILLVFLIMLAACQTAPSAAPTPTVIAFPTMTPGQMIRAALPPPVAVPLTAGSINPASALQTAPTDTPNLRACPTPDSTVALLSPPPPTGRGMEGVIAGFMNTGGTAVTLDRALRDEWNVLGETGSVRADVDLTGEGTAETLISFVTPDEGGVLVVIGCIDGRTQSIYYGALVGAAPQIIRVEDMNANGLTDVLFTSNDCDAGVCQYRTQLISWSGERARMVNLLGGALDTDSPPRVEDIDQDRVSEIIDDMTDDGNAQTGPLRTGYTVYDWDGATYTRSITQLNPPRFRIQIIHQADAAFADENMEEAISLYTLAINDTGLDAWTNDEISTLQAYALYRLLLAYSFLDDERRIDVHLAITAQYPDANTAPVYATMAFSFWNALQITNNLHSACLEVSSIISTRAEAVGLLNRYGSRSPTYSALDLCPF